MLGGKLLGEARMLSDVNLIESRFLSLIAGPEGTTGFLPLDRASPRRLPATIRRKGRADASEAISRLAP